MPVLTDVARLAGVSHQTVSRVLNDSPNVRPDTRERVLSAVRSLDYRPNSAARTLASRRSRTLGVISFDSTLHGPSHMLYGVEQAARVAGFYVSIASLSSQDAPSVQEAVGRLRGQAVEGIAVIASRASTVAGLARSVGDVPTVSIGPIGPGQLPGAGVDNRTGARAAVRHLLDLGHPTVHHVAGPPDWLEADSRAAGWEEELKAQGSNVVPALLGDWSARSGYEAGRHLAEDRTVTAVFCANDHMALGVLQALHERGRRVPQEVSVMGFDDIPEAAYLTPSLTTVRQDFGELGRRGLELLLGRIREVSQRPDEARRSHTQAAAVVAPEIVLRSSTGPWRR
jgi:DNA-binding LacI/PurR family transcriptional regulator